jgi:hypothetical protein
MGETRIECRVSEGEFAGNRPLGSYGSELVDMTMDLKDVEWEDVG